MNTSYDLDLMLASWCIAVAAAYAAFDLGGRIAGFDGPQRWLWLLLGALAVGSGIWAAHYTGMQAQGLPVQLSFHLGLSVLSWLAAVGAALLALHLISGAEPSPQGLVGGGLLIGLGICLMQYLGLAALRLNPAIRYDPALLGAAAVVAVDLSIGALLIGFSMRRLPEWQLAPGKGCGALLMGTAIGGMHYAAMSAARITAGAASAPDNGLAGGWLGLPLALCTIAFIAAVMLLSMFDAQRQEARWQERQQVFAARFRRRLARG